MQEVHRKNNNKPDFNINLQSKGKIVEQNNIIPRVEKLEQTTQEQQIAIALIERQQSTIQKGLDNINDNIKWLVRLVAGGLILAVVGFIAQGGIA